MKTSNRTRSVPLSEKTSFVYGFLRNNLGTEITFETYEYSFYQAYTTARWYANRRYLEFGTKFDIVKIWDRGINS